MLAIAVIMPFLLSALVSALVHKEKIHKYAALVASIASFIIAVILYLNPVGLQTITWFSAGSLVLQLSTNTAPLNTIFLLLVSIIAPLIVVYSMGFMRTPSEQRSYYFMLSVFTAGIMLFTIGADLITLFIGWELMGLTSYLLIGFWRYKDSAIAGARKAITIILLGDMLVFASIMIIWTQLHTFSLQTLLQYGYYYPSIKFALALMILGAFTKSAQFPFHEWLPDAMEGPTPVSAFLHSSTMVKAGIFLIALFLPLIAQYGLNYLLLAFGIVTAAIGALSAVSETHIKRILAYSTIEDIGLMFVALGLNSLPAAMLLFVVQTFYKALLFMSAGSIMQANDGEENINKLEGPASSMLVLIPTVIGVASIAGIFPLSGFFGKIGIESATSNIYIYVALLAIELLSTIYIFRWLLVPLRNKKSAKTQQPSKYHSISKLMLLPIIILAILVFAASAAYFYLPAMLGGSAPQISSLASLHTAVFLVLIIVGALISYLVYYKRSVFGSKTRTEISQGSYSSKYVNMAYAVIGGGLLRFAGAVTAIDGYLYIIVKDGGVGIKKIGKLLGKMESGSLNYYLLAFVIGLIVVILFAFVV